VVYDHILLGIQAFSFVFGLLHRYPHGHFAQSEIASPPMERAGVRERFESFRLARGNLRLSEIRLSALYPFCVLKFL
jgi:hypothetical protein